MASTRAAALSQDSAQSIEQLTKRYGELHKKQIEAQANLKNAERQLESLRADAREKYQTDDLATLREKLAEMKAENERMRSEYQASLDKIESDLITVEANFAALENRQTTEKGT